MKSLARWLILLAIAGFPHHGYAPPPSFGEDRQQFPGKDGGNSETYWLAPYVKWSSETVGQYHSQVVIWYSHDEPRNMLNVDSAYGGFATARINDEHVILGINEDWKIVLPPKAGPKEETVWQQSSKDSHVFVRQLYRSNEHQISEEIYLSGVVQPIIGPFIRYLGRHFEMGADGSTAGLVWKDESKTTAQLVVTEASGKMSFRVDCEATDQSPEPAPNGAGALLPGKGGTDQNNFFAWYTAAGKLRAVKLEPNPNLIGWVPGTLKSLFTTSLGYDDRYRLIDWADGSECWDIGVPGGGYTLAIGITPRLILFEVAELVKPGPWSGDSRFLEKTGKEWVRAFYAVSPKDGHIISQWQAHFGRRLENYYHDHFFLLGTKLYFVSADEFVELSEDDILKGDGGWKQ